MLSCKFSLIKSHEIPSKFSSLIEAYCLKFGRVIHHNSLQFFWNGILSFFYIQKSYVVVLLKLRVLIKLVWSVWFCGWSLIHVPANMELFFFKAYLASFFSFNCWSLEYSLFYQAQSLGFLPYQYSGCCSNCSLLLWVWFFINHAWWALC